MIATYYNQTKQIPINDADSYPHILVNTSAPHKKFANMTVHKDFNIKCFNLAVNIIPIRVIFSHIKS